MRRPSSAWGVHLIVEETAVNGWINEGTKKTCTPDGGVISKRHQILNNSQTFIQRTKP